jgi:hypothetical protein
VTRLTAFGLSLAVPARWHARAFRHAGGEPTLHLASFALPAGDGEFGTRATSAMPATGVFIALTEYRARPEALRHGLFAGRRPDGVPPQSLSAHALLRQLPGQRGAQRFFSCAGRAFCLYVVAAGESGTLLDTANAALASLAVEPLD